MKIISMKLHKIHTKKLVFDTGRMKKIIVIKFLKQSHGNKINSS